MHKIRNLVTKNQVITFFLLTYIISWGLMLPFARSYFQKGVYFAGIPFGWGIFGPALSGILITQFVNPEEKEAGRKLPLNVFSLGLIVSALVFILHTLLQARLALTSEIVIGVIIMGVMIAIPPAFVIASTCSRNRKVREYLDSLIKPRGPFVYYLLSLFIRPFTFWLGSVISKVLGKTAYYSPPSLVGWRAVSTLLLTFIYQFFSGNALGEEVGWRGFALPRLQAQFSPLIASLIIALLWWPWHLPFKWFAPDVLPNLFYALGFIPSSIFLTWLFNRTNGSILAVGIAHVASNVAGKILFPITNIGLVLHFIVAFILVIIDRMWEKKTFANSSVFSTTTAGNAVLNR
jgi:membrane protease YdiL (CAAX protease family)